MFGARRVARRTARRTSRRVARRNMLYGGYEEEPYGDTYYEEEPYSTPAETRPAETKPTMQQELQSLQEMKSKGLITDEDYNAKKKQILGI